MNLDEMEERADRWACRVIAAICLGVILYALSP